MLDPVLLLHDRVHVYRPSTVHIVYNIPTPKISNMNQKHRNRGLPYRSGRRLRRSLCRCLVECLGGKWKRDGSQRGSAGSTHSLSVNLVLQKKSVGSKKKLKEYSRKRHICAPWLDGLAHAFHTCSGAASSAIGLASHPTERTNEQSTQSHTMLGRDKRQDISPRFTFSNRSWSACFGAASNAMLRGPYRIASWSPALLEVAAVDTAVDDAEGTRL
jgi:hypothetical protein